MTSFLGFRKNHNAKQLQMGFELDGLLKSLETATMLTLLCSFKGLGLALSRFGQMFRGFDDTATSQVILYLPTGGFSWPLGGQ